MLGSLYFFYTSAVQQSAKDLRGVYLQILESLLLEFSPSIFSWSPCLYLQLTSQPSKAATSILSSTFLCSSQWLGSTLRRKLERCISPYMVSFSRVSPPVSVCIWLHSSDLKELITIISRRIVWHRLFCLYWELELYL